MRHIALALLLASTALHATTGQKETQSLLGRWRFELDAADRGLQERWFARHLAGELYLPGTLTAQGIGEDISTNTPWTGGIVDSSWFSAPEYAKYREPGNVKVPFWLQPGKYYAGAAWYQRDIEIPDYWQGKRVVLFLERAHWETRVWVDTQLVGTNNSLSTPHEYDLGQLSPGTHTLTIRVDNRRIVDIGENSHGISDHTQGNWNGIVGRLELRTTPLVWIEDLQVYPHPNGRQVTVKGSVGNATGQTVTNALGFCLLDRFDARPRIPTTNILLICTSESTSFESQVSCSSRVSAWDEFAPHRLELTTRFSALQSVETRRDLVGLRDFNTTNTQFLINGRKTFLRGTLECAIFPKTGQPSMGIETWLRIIRTCKAHGLNLIRFHSWCPPEAAFQAADELGFYLQVETCWPNQSTTLGDGKPVDQWVYDETDRILKYYGNHPSFILMACGNEPGGTNQTAFLAKYLAHYKAKDPRRLWTSGSGWPEIAENQFHVLPGPRIQQWGQGLDSRINARPPETVTDYREFIQQRDVPVISHEIGQWCVYPNFEEMAKYTGYLKPRNFEVFRDSLEANHMGPLAKDFLLASGKLQAMCYKEEIESALRTPGMGGFQLLDLHDFPGQGTALVGVLDPFWEEKGYITAKEFRRFCNSTVPLARLPKRVYTTDETLEADVEVAHFGPEPLLSPAVSEELKTLFPSMNLAWWKLVNPFGVVVKSNAFEVETIPSGGLFPLGRISVDLADARVPGCYQLVVSLTGSMRRSSDLAGQPIESGQENDWLIWVYPAKVDTSVPSGITVAHALDDRALATLNDGGKVLLLVPPARVKGDEHGKVALGFSPIFWNTAWTGRQAPHTLGILCDSKHPVFGRFPTGDAIDWQWWYLVSRAGAMILDDLPQELNPMVRVIDDWVTNRRLGLLFEAKVANGKLLVCSIDLERDLDSNPVARQFRASLLHYMASDRFQPTVEVAASPLESLMVAEARSETNADREDRRP